MSVRRKRQNTGRVPELVVFWGVLCCAVLYCAVRRCEMLPAACWRGLDGNWKWKIGIGVVGKRAQRHRASAADTLSHEGFNEDEWGAQGMRGHALIQADGGVAQRRELNVWCSAFRGGMGVRGHAAGGLDRLANRLRLAP